jgi:hypothetical protein
MDKGPTPAPTSAASCSRCWPYLLASIVGWALAGILFVRTCVRSRHPPHAREVQLMERGLYQQDNIRDDRDEGNSDDDREEEESPMYPRSTLGSSSSEATYCPGKRIPKVNSRVKGNMWVK